MVITRSIFSRFFPLMLLCLFIACSMAYAQPLPWENEDSVSSILLNQDGQGVLLEKVTVSKIEARNDPPYFVVQDRFKPDNKIVILSRPPSSLTCGMTVDVTGTLVTLNTGESCLTDATTFGYFNKDGSLIGWSYCFMLCADRQALPIPAAPIPPSDPSLTADGSGIPGLVTSEPAEKPSVYGTVASLTSAPLLSTVEVSCKPVRETGAGYITVGDDDSDAAIKVYTTAAVNPTDRIIKLTGTLHTEKGSHVIYADSGPEPYFDHQGYIGHVFSAGVGTVAYAATLSNPSESVSKTGGIRAMSASAPDTTNGNWVYLTGKLITYVGGYWSYDASPAGWKNVCNIQGIDKIYGMRAWNPASITMSVGSVVDVFAEVDTKDGQRLLGKYGQLDSVEYKTLASPSTNNPLKILPVGMSNKTLGGEALGYNPTVTGGVGIHNIGSYVTVWGKVLEVGTCFDRGSLGSTPYMRIDDGSAVPSDGTAGKGVIVYGCNSYGYTPAVVGDYVAVTGVSSVWKPIGSTDTYRCMWTNAVRNLQSTSASTETREVTATGTISGMVKIYDIPPPPANNPNEPVIVHARICCNRNHQTWFSSYTYYDEKRNKHVTQDIPVVRQTDGTGTVSYSFENVAKEIMADGLFPEYPKYIVSAKCDGYKTRTYINVSPDTTRNLYLTPLKKIYVTVTGATTLNPGGSTTITAAVRDANHNLVTGETVRFRTNKGSFYSDGIAHSISAVIKNNDDDSEKVASVTYYAASSETGSDVVIEATDDSAPHAGDPLWADTYNYDWVQVHSSEGTPVSVTVNGSSTVIDTFVLTANPYSVPPAAASSTITAKLTALDGTKIVGRSVCFSTTAGTITPTAVTNANGEATATLTGVTAGGFAIVTASTTNDPPAGIPSYTYTRRLQVDFLQSASDDWPMFMHDSRHQGYSRFYDTTTTEGLALAWSAPVPTSDAAHSAWGGQHPYGVHTNTVFHHPYIDSSPVHANGCPVIVGAWASGAYTDTATAGYVEAFNPTSGASAWRYPSGTDYIGAVASTPAVFTSGEEKRVVFGCMDGKVYCLNAVTGVFIWSYQTQNSTGGNGKVLASPVVYDGRVYIGNESATIYCLNASTGALIWSYTLQRDNSWPDRTGVSSVAIGPTASGEMRAFVGCDNGHVYCLSIADTPSKRLIWDYAGEDGIGIGCVESSPTVYNGNVYIGTSWFEGNDIMALDAGNGELLWEKVLGEEIRATAVALSGHLFVGDDTGWRFFKLNTNTGNLNPNQSPPNPFDARLYRPSLAGDNNYFVGSAAFTSAGFGLVGNDNFALYTLSSADISHITTRGTEGIVCSSPAISYAAQSSYRWVYVLSRANGGTLLAYQQQLN